MEVAGKLRLVAAAVDEELVAAAKEAVPLVQRLEEPVALVALSASVGY